MDVAKLPIFDCHHHYIDARRLRYPVFEERSAAFEALVGNYEALPRVYLPADYASDIEGLNVVATAWAEFISTAPVAEARWAAELTQTDRATALIARVEFEKPDLDRMLDDYAALDRLRCVRQHLAWHPTNPLLRFGPAADILADAGWRRGLGRLCGRGLRCEIEIFSPQLFGLADVAARYPAIQFIIPVMGWPIDLSAGGFEDWRRGLAAAAACANVALKIFGMECIFGVGWRLPQIRPWILEAIAIFGPDHCMFASHAPICQLSRSVRRLYDEYFEIIADFALSDQRKLLHDTAARIYGL